MGSGGWPGRLEGFPDFLAVDVFADRPGDFAGSLLFAGQQVRRLDVVHHDGALADANLPGKFAEHVARGGFGGLEVAKVFAEIVGAWTTMALRTVGRFDLQTEMSFQWPWYSLR